MDNVYGKRDRDILVTNVLVLIGKLRALKKVSPDTPVDIFVTSAALSSCGADARYILDN